LGRATAHTQTVVANKNMIEKIQGILRRLFVESYPSEGVEYEAEEIVIERSDGQEIVFPKQLDTTENFRITRWLVDTGAELKKGDKLCVIENENGVSMEFESFLKGRLNYKFPEKQILKQNSVIARIGSLK